MVQTTGHNQEQKNIEKSLDSFRGKKNASKLRLTCTTMMGREKCGKGEKQLMT